MMMTSFMVTGSVLWMEGGGLGLARNIVQRYALETGSEQGFGIGEKVAQPTSNAISTASSIAASRPRRNGMEASKGAIAISVKPAAVRMRATRPPVAEREWAARYAHARRPRRADDPYCGHPQTDAMVHVHTDA